MVRKCICRPNRSQCPIWCRVGLIAMLGWWNSLTITWWKILGCPHIGGHHTAEHRRESGHRGYQWIDAYIRYACVAYLLASTWVALCGKHRFRRQPCLRRRQWSMFHRLVMTPLAIMLSGSSPITCGTGLFAASRYQSRGRSLPARPWVA